MTGTKSLYRKKKVVIKNFLLLKKLLKVSLHCLLNVVKLLITDFNYKINLKQNTDPKPFSLKTWIEFEKHKKNFSKTTAAS